MRIPATIFTLSVAVAACSTAGPLSPGFEQQLTRQGGCADVVFYAVDDDDEVMLSFRADGLVAEARDAGGETVTTLDLSEPGAVVIVERGSRISDAMCDDVIEDGGPQVSRTWEAVGGSATVTVRPGPEDFGARADLRLTDVVLDDGSGDRIVLPEMIWLDVSVGWYPG